MKKFRKLFAVLTASALVGAMSFTTMAASIKINHDDTYDGTVKQTYKAYKILDVVKDTAGKPEDAKAFAYTFAKGSEWKDVLTDSRQTWLDCKPSADGAKYIVTLKAGVTGDEATAKAMAKYFNEHIPEGAAYTSLTADEAKTAVDDGYYLITSTLGTNLILATSDIEIKEKNDYPKDDKKVETGSLTIGENATYYITVVVPESIDTTKDIKVHDKLPAELSYNDDVKVYVADTKDVDAGTAVSTLKDFDYTTLATDTVVAKSALGDDCTFHINIKPTAYVGKTLVFRYSAKLLETAAADHGFVNKEFLTYSEYKTTEKDVPVMTYDFDLTKTFKDSTKEQTGLKATFNLYTADEYTKLTDNDPNTTASTMKFKTDSDNQNHYYVSSSGNEDIEATKGNAVNVRGLGEGTYYLVETATANGYNVLDHEITITVTATYDETTGHVNGGRVSIKNGEAESKDAVEVENVKGLLLPSTGGMGTVAFAVVGLIVMAGAAITLIIKKRA